MVSDNEIINYFYSQNGEGRFCPKRLKQLNNYKIKHYLEHRYKDSSSLLETIYRIYRHHIVNHIHKYYICNLHHDGQP